MSNYTKQDLHTQAVSLQGHITTTLNKIDSRLKRLRVRRFTPDMPLEHRLQVLIKDATPTETGCLVLDCSLNNAGYPYLCCHSSVMTVARGILVVQGIDMTGLCACHTCDNRQCVNPEHIVPGTPSDNLLDASVKGRLRKLSRAQSDEIRTLYALGTMTQHEIALEYGVTQSIVSRIVNRLTHTRVPSFYSTALRTSVNGGVL